MEKMTEAKMQSRFTHWLKRLLAARGKVEDVSDKARESGSSDLSREGKIEDVSTVGDFSRGVKIVDIADPGDFSRGGVDLFKMIPSNSAFELKIINCSKDCKHEQFGRKEKNNLPSAWGDWKGGDGLRSRAREEFDGFWCHTCFKPSALSEGQTEALTAVKHYGLVYKISDSALGWKPWDCFILGGRGSGAGAFVVLGWYCGGSLRVYALDIDVFKAWTAARGWKVGARGAARLGLSEEDASAMGFRLTGV